MSLLTAIITSPDPDVRNRSLDGICRGFSTQELLDECTSLDTFRRSRDNLYHRVRALFFLSAIHRYYLPFRADLGRAAQIPFPGYSNLLTRRFEEAINTFLAAQSESGPSAAMSSALAVAYRSLAFQTLADQVRRSVRSVRGNQWMFRASHPSDYPLQVRPELLVRADGGALYPILAEA